MGSLPNHHITLPTRGGVGLFGVVVFFWCYPFLTTRPQGSVDVISLYPLPDPQKISRIGGALQNHYLLQKFRSRGGTLDHLYYPAYPWVWVGVGLFGVVVFFWRYPFLTARPQGSVDVISLYPLPDPQGSVCVVFLYPLPDPQKISRRGGVPKNHYCLKVQ